MIGVPMTRVLQSIKYMVMDPLVLVVSYSLFSHCADRLTTFFPPHARQRLKLMRLYQRAASNLCDT